MYKLIVSFTDVYKSFIPNKTTLLSTFWVLSLSQ